MASCSRSVCQRCAAQLGRISQANPLREVHTLAASTSASSTWAPAGYRDTHKRPAIPFAHGYIFQRRIHTSLRQNQQASQNASPTITILGKEYPRDDYTNIPNSILSRLAETPQLLRTDSHPLNLLQRQIESSLRGDFTSVTPPSPVVSAEDNFGKLGFPEDHPGRAPTDTYYINKQLCLRTHTSTHEADTFAKGHTHWLLTADVFRRDEIDASHYPIFHQMEGAAVWDLADFAEGGVVEKECERMEGRLTGANIAIQDQVDLNEAGGYQAAHAQDAQMQRAAELAMRHLKATLNNLTLDLFRARHAANKRIEARGNVRVPDELKVRWIAAHFPFTSPSFEVEVFFQGKWLEILGCGIVQQRTLDEAKVEGKLGWAFGLGLERIAMVLFSIPDIRLFWSQDPRFLSQFSNDAIKQQAGKASSKAPSAGVSAAGGAVAHESSRQGKMPLITFKPYSKHPGCYKDISFWLPEHGKTHDNDIFEIIRDVAGDLCETVELTDDFVSPKTQRRSKCFRITYRSMDENMTNVKANVLQRRVQEQLVDQLGVDLR